MRLFYFFTFIFCSISLFLSLQLYGKELPIMLEIKNKNLPSDFRDAVEESLTEFAYELVDEKIQALALEEQKKQHASDCYDDACLVDTGKMLSAKAILMIDTQKRAKAYKFTLKYIDLEKGVTTKSITKYYEHQLEDSRALFLFGKDCVRQLFKKPIPLKTQRKPKDSRWLFSLGSNIGVSIKTLDVEGIHFGGAGILLSANGEVAYSLVKRKDEMTINLFLEASYGRISGTYKQVAKDVAKDANVEMLTDELMMTSSLIHLSIGAEFIYGKKTLSLPLFMRIAIINGWMDYAQTAKHKINQHVFNTFGISFQIGIDQEFYGGIFDFYIGSDFHIYMREMSDPDIKISGMDIPVYLGLRHTF